MGILTRIVKVLGALLTSNVVNLITKLVLPPIFLLRYGTTLYGEWLALSGAVAYLSTLNFGIQTYVTQDLTVRYQANDLAAYHRRQSTSLRVLLGILGSAAVVCLIVFALPVQHWLRLTLTQRATAITLYFLALQVLLGVLFGYFTGLFMVLSRAHTGVLWVNGLRLAMVLAVSAAAWFRVPLPVLAGVQAAVYVAGIVLVLLHLYRAGREIFPSLGEWDRAAVPGILKPSSYFGLISMSTFLSYEVPVLILQREAGPFVVVAFTVMRTIFSMCRQILSSITQAVGPEITRLFGRKEWSQLSSIYAYSERLTFFLIPIINLGVLVLSPLLVTAWLRKPDLFTVWPYTVMATISMILTIKGHKFQFQFSTNTHEALARIMFGSYMALAVLAVPVVRWQGMMGFLYLWLAVEVYQLIRMIQLNRKLFRDAGGVTLKYAKRMALLVPLGVLSAGIVVARTCRSPYPIELIAALTTSSVLGGSAYFLFDVQQIAVKISARLRARINRPT